MATIRRERPEDVAGIHDVHAASFPTDAEARLVDALRAAGRLVHSVVAEIDGEVVGHAGFSPVRLEGASAGIGLAPVAVLPAHRRRGIAAQVVREGLLACERAGAGFVVVLGDPAYYGRFGFVPAASLALRDEYGGGEAFQVLEVRPGAVPAGGGVVRYAPEFSLFSDGDVEPPDEG